jgi:hypothetical protein
MSRQRDERYARSERRGFDAGGPEDRNWRQREDHAREYARSGGGGLARGEGAERFGSEDFGSSDAPNRYGTGDWRAERESFGNRGDYGRERDYRDYGRGQPGGAYEHAGDRGYRHGGGYGGYGEQPGEAGGAFDSGRSYASEPGWGPGYGDEARSHRAYEGQGGVPGSYGAQRGAYGRAGGGYRDGGRGSYGQGQYDQGDEQQRSGTWGRGQGSYGRPQGGQGFGHGQYGQGFGEAGHSYGEQGFGPSGGGYRAEDRQRRQARGPKGYQRSDERLREDICERLMGADHIDAADVSVEVKSGNVTLDGSVPQRRMKHAIEDLVDACMGVRDIDNKLRVGRAHEAHSETTTSIGSGGGQGSGGSSGHS